MKNKIFAEGIIFKKPDEKTPNFVKGKISIKVAEFIAFLEKNKSGEWVNLNVKESKGGKWYLELDTWKPDKDKTKDNLQDKAKTIEYPKETIDPDEILF